MYRVLKPNIMLVLSDPVADKIPENSQVDEKLRALCFSGYLPLTDYINMITDVGF